MTIKLALNTPQQVLGLWGMGGGRQDDTRFNALQQNAA